MSISEATIEDAVREWFTRLGYQTLYGPDIAPGERAAERRSYTDVVLVERLRAAVARINPGVPPEAREEAIRQVLRTQSPTLVGENHRIHRLLTDGVPVESRYPDGAVKHDLVWLIDFDKPASNDWLVVNQFTVIEHQRRRPDVVVFVNGLPLAVIELKDPAADQPLVRAAFNQLQTYKQDIPTLFHYNAVLVASDGLEARVGTLTAGWDRFSPWRTIDGVAIAPRDLPEIRVAIEGIFDQQRFLDLMRHFVVFERDRDNMFKKLAAYHQFHAVNKAVARTLEAASSMGDRRVGVIWHTQGSGKSLSMAFYAGKIIRHPAMANPTLVVITDRNDLDDQLFQTFTACYELLRQTPVQAESRAHLRELLRVPAGGVVFTTIQKFLPEEKGDRHPLLSDRRNIVVIADEAHRSQYDFVDGFARHVRDALPNASFIAFTGTPIETDDRSTRAVFGDYIDIYDIQRAVVDGFTVPIYYEGRTTKLALDETERPHIDEEFEELTEGEELEQKERLKSRWARLEAVVGSEKRIALVARDIVDHFERRLEALEGKGMIVCMSRRICVALYNEIIRLRPEWHSDDDDQGVIKVVMTGSAADPEGWQPHIRSKARRVRIADRFRNAHDPLKLVIVRDMWLTGFDAPALHTMYVDKPMRGHGLMQAIARVNRVFKDKPGGLIVDYIGIADQLKRALVDYTERDRGQTGIPQETAVRVMLDKYQVVAAMFDGLDYTPALNSGAADRVQLLNRAMNHILAQDNGKQRYEQAVNDLSRAFALAVPHEKAMALQEEVAFFQLVRNLLARPSSQQRDREEEYDSAISRLVSRAVAADEVIDIFAAAGLKIPDISILSDEFLEEVRGLEHRNLAIELLRRLLDDEIKVRSQRNVVEARSFAAMLERTIRSYENRSLETAEIITELINMAKDLRASARRGEQLGLNPQELAFYDALAAVDTAAEVLDDAVLRTIARELVETVRRNTSIDWTLRESARAKVRAAVRRLLRKHGYPTAHQEEVVVKILQQAELFTDQWAA